MTFTPVPSEEVADLLANIKTEDIVVNGDELTTVTRTTKVVRTFAGINAAYDSAEAARNVEFQQFLAASGFEYPPLVYVDGVPLQVDRSTQTIERAGNIYSVKVPNTFPFVLTGTFATDEPNLVLRNDQTLRTDLLATSGSGLVGFIHSFLGAVPMTVQEVLRLGIDVRMAGALPAPFDSSAIFQELALTVKALGGGKIIVGPGLWYAPEMPNFTHVYWEGAGKGATTISQPPGSNKDMVVSEDFATLTGVGPLRNAPHHYGMKAMTIDGNHMVDYKLASIGGDTTLNNTVGYGVKNFGSCFDFDLEIVNCAQVMFYSEAVDYTGYGFEQSSRMYLTGRVSGKESLVYRGPADCNIEHAIIGCPAWKPTLAQRRAALVYSDIWPGEVVDGMVSDESEITPGGLLYNGHHEFGMIHMYGNLSGIGYRCRNTGRLKGNHLVSENNRGGVEFATRTWGILPLVECHNNQREPADLAGTLPSLPDIYNKSIQGLTLNAVVRHVKTQAAVQLALKDESAGSDVTLNFFTAGGAPVAGSYVASLVGSSKFDITLQDVNQDAIVLNSAHNKIDVLARRVTNGAVVRRIAGPSSVNRDNDIYIHTLPSVTTAFYLDGLVTNERLAFIGEVATGGAIFDPAGSQPNMVGQNTIVTISGRIGSASICSRDSIRSNLDTTTTGVKTITVAHSYFQTPDAGQISVSVYDPSPAFTGSLKDDPVIQTITATDITFAYEVLTTGTGGPLVLCAQIR